MYKHTRNTSLFLNLLTVLLKNGLCKNYIDTIGLCKRMARIVLGGIMKA